MKLKGKKLNAAAIRKRDKLIKDLDEVREQGDRIKRYAAEQKLRRWCEARGLDPADIYYANKDICEDCKYMPTGFDYKCKFTGEPVTSKQDACENKEVRDE